MKTLLKLMLVLGLASVATVAQAAPIHYLQGAGSSDPTAPITASGNTPVALNDLTAGDLANVGTLWITNGANNDPPSEVINNIAALSDWVFAGGVLSYHDRYVGGGAVDMANVLPGGASIVLVRDFSNDSDIDILLPAHPVVAGLDNTSLDGGSSSSHGYVDLASLPAGAVAILNRGGSPTEIVDFYYQFGLGWVYYSTIPLDFYLAGFGSDPPQGDFANIYAVNEAGFQASLAQAVPVPEPNALFLILVGAAFALSIPGIHRRTA